MAIFLALLATFFCLVSSQSDCGERGATSTITDTVGLQSFNACSTVYGSLYVYSVPGNVKMSDALHSISGGLYCTGEGNDQTTNAINAQNLVSVASDPALEETTSGPAVGFVIVDYPTLSSLTFPDLTTVGSDFIIAGNPKLTTIEFNSLQKVTGNVDISGDIEFLELPSLSFVNGSVNLQTSSTSFNCPPFDNVVILGTYNCSVGVINPQPLTADNSSTNPIPVNPISASVSSAFSSAASSATSSATRSITRSTSRSATTISSVSTSTSSATAGSTKSSASCITISFSFWRIGVGLVSGLFFI